MAATDGLGWPVASDSAEVLAALLELRAQVEHLAAEQHAMREELAQLHEPAPTAEIVPLSLVDAYPTTELPPVPRERPHRGLGRLIAPTEQV